MNTQPQKKLNGLRQLVNIYAFQISYTKQIVDMAKIFFEDAKELSDEGIEEIKNADGRAVIEEFKKQLDLIPRFTA
ncbi:hypothetical protein, partial [Bacillus thuringiensis]|uniref:hypothetical protein n=1 Tax=Bacillus thuringiensis TaxID=1428 RepID=UPI0028525062